LEYKSRVPDKEDKFLKTVAAFANGSGGIILVGIADNGYADGINEDEITSFDLLSRPEHVQ
jgi:predicted HTH transcriptional regulator